MHYIEGRATVKDKHTVSINGKDYTVGDYYWPTVLHSAAVAHCVLLLSSHNTLLVLTAHRTAGAPYILPLLHYT